MSLIDRLQLEARERSLLAPYAMPSADSRGRVEQEPEDALRTAYQRDRDRIIHAKAFRRLARKTQVYPYQKYDHARTRLTHSLEVAQIGRAIARAVGCNEDLVEAICLAHDLGHPPFGHAGEKALDGLMKNVGGFDHQIQSYRLLTELEQRRPGQPGLNLTYEVLEGIQKHDPCFRELETPIIHPEERATLEAQISNLADEIAYSSSDLDDYLRSSYPHSANVPIRSLAIVRQVMDRKDNAVLKKANLTESVERKHLISEVVDLLVTDCIRTTLANLEAMNIQSLADVRHHPDNLADYSCAMARMKQELKDFLMNEFYLHSDVEQETSKGMAMIEELFQAYCQDPSRLPPDQHLALQAAPREKVIGEYIAGMTDPYLFQCVRELQLSPDAVPPATAP